MTARTCRRCHLRKRLSSFYADRDARAGYKATCIDCYLMFQRLSYWRRKFLRDEATGRTDAPAKLRRRPHGQA